jgi:1-aminocyclopropane-1-carboxylate deaminase/D-cysteine desulfhydrase-like pyridoxal-dependent ACC family enzyme
VDLLSASLPTPLQLLSNVEIELAGVRLYIKRDDLIHPTVSGNKWRKLKYSLLEAKTTNKQAILTFGGAYSNHLYATAAAGNALGIRTIGVVRGLDFAERDTPTLRFCREQGMQLHFVSREIYRLRHSEEYLADIAREFGDPFMIPEGGTTALALKGVSEMVDEVSEQLGHMPRYFATAAGTGGTAAGILSAKADVLAFSALKGGGFLNDDIRNLLVGAVQPGKLTLFTEYHFGGYAKWNAELLGFMQSFNDQFGIQLEQVYTAKMFYGLFDLIRKGYFTKGSVIVAVHTGGLQGLLRN